MEKEIWRDIVGYEGKYQVSNCGRVRSVKRTVWDNRGYYKTVPEKILKVGITSRGYAEVQLWKDGIKKYYLVHRLVGQAFLPNPEKLPQVNHKDENKQNNNVDNLEFCSVSYNNTYNGKAKKAGKKISEKLRGRKLPEEQIKKIAEKNRNHPRKSKPIMAIDMVTGLRLVFPSIREAERQLRVSNNNIAHCLKGRHKTAGGYIWKYIEDKEDK